MPSTTIRIPKLCTLPNQAAQQLGIGMVSRDPLHKTAVNLDQIHRVTTQIVQRGKTGPKVIDGDLAARLRSARGYVAGAPRAGSIKIDSGIDLEDDRRRRNVITLTLYPGLIQTVWIQGLELKHMERLMESCSQS